MCNGSSDQGVVVGEQGLSNHCLLIRNAAYLNRDGATLLVAGDLNMAVDRLFDALDTLMQAGGFLPAPTVAVAYMSRSFPFEIEVPGSRRSSASSPNNECDDGSYFVYGNPFVFHPILVDTPEYAANCVAVVLFNLGLALHQRGRQADSRALYRARSMYDMSLALVATMSCQAACSNLKVAATNNKAHVQFEVSDVRDAKSTLHSLLNILSTTKTNPPPFEEVEIEKFYMNILHLNASTLAGAA